MTDGPTLSYNEEALIVSSSADSCAKTAFIVAAVFGGLTLLVCGGGLFLVQARSMRSAPHRAPL